MKQTVFLLALLLSGCSITQAPEPAKVMVRQMESRLELASVRLPEAGHRSQRFINELSEHSDHLSLRIQYGPGAKEMANALKLNAYGQGISPVRVSLVALPGSARDKLTLDARYLLIHSDRCGRLSMANREQYSFGCTLEYNRTLSLSNPMPGGAE